jgi:hypothetical protein
MGQKRSAGTIIYISATAPSTFNQAGYEAIGDFSELGEALNIDGFGPRWQTESNPRLKQTGTKKNKTSRDGGQMTIDLALDTDDAGQIKAKAGRDGTAAVSIKVTEPNGDDYYCQLLITQFDVMLGNNSSTQKAKLIGEVDCSDDDVDWVEVLA